MPNIKVKQTTTVQLELTVDKLRWLNAYMQNPRDDIDEESDIDNEMRCSFFNSTRNALAAIRVAPKTRARAGSAASQPIS